MNFRGPKAHPNRGEKPPRTSGNLLRLPAFFMSFRGPKAHPNRFEKPPRGVGSEPGDRQDWQRISGKMRRKSMPVLSVPGARVGGDEVSMAVFYELSRAEGPSQQTGLTANFRQSQPEIHGRLVSPRDAAYSWAGFPKTFQHPRGTASAHRCLSLIHISEPTRLGMISYAVFCLKKKKKK